MTNSALPIQASLPELLSTLARQRTVILQAPPGAGKTTKVPLALLDQPWVGATGRILLLEPRRLAARAAASRMAALLGEEIGQTVGYRMRLDKKIGPLTRIEVITEGVLIRLLQHDPTLCGVAAILFDEFHERSLDADLALALCLEVQAVLRDDLRLLIMSATLESERIAALLEGAPIVACSGRSFPVAVRWLDKPSARHKLEETMAAAIRLALSENATGDLLAFLPGTAEIRRTAGHLNRLDPSIDVVQLYGDLSPADQDRALQPAAPGRRKIVLATSIAETSLTIEGVQIVVDCGLARRQRFDANTGMSRLETVPVSQAAAEQRRGRAGRLAAGTCYRLWSQPSHGAMPCFAAAEILQADLASLALDLAEWGSNSPTELRWLDSPPEGSYNQAIDLLQNLGALDANARITPHGRAMARLPMHPRLAHMLLSAQTLGARQAALACDIAALLSSNDRFRGKTDSSCVDLRSRLEYLYEQRTARESEPIHALARQWRKRLNLQKTPPCLEDTGAILALAYPDRIGKRRNKSEAVYLLNCGRGATLPKEDPLAASDYLVAAHLDGAGRNARILLAARISELELEACFGDRIQWRDLLEWDENHGCVQTRRQKRFGALVLKDLPLLDPPANAVQAAFLEGIRKSGLACLPWTQETLNWRARLAFLHRADPQTRWPNVSDAALLDCLEKWLAPDVTDIKSLSQLRHLSLDKSLQRLLSWQERQKMDSLAPSHIRVPSGSLAPIRYDLGDDPVLAVRLQEMFGLPETPTIMRQSVPLLLHLLSPARRLVQATRDLAGFWSKSYRQVQADLKGQYPKHFWPDDPLAATPTSGTKKQLQKSEKNSHKM